MSVPREVCQTVGKLPAMFLVSQTLGIPFLEADDERRADRSSSTRLLQLRNEAIMDVGSALRERFVRYRDHLESEPLSGREHAFEVR
jgi:hypothetical protein